MSYLVLILALIWGGVWALFLEYVPFGKWLAAKRVWMTVVIGIGVDLGILATALEWQTFWLVCGVIAASSIGVICRSLAHEMHEWHALMEQSRGAQTQRRK